MNPRNILFIHQAFPGQFGTLARSLAADGHRVTALAINPQEKIPGVMTIRYSPIAPQEKDLGVLTQDMDAKFLRGQGILEAMKAMKANGYMPDVIYVHPGWGEGMFIKNVWPDARLVVYAEWFYNKEGQEINFDPAFPPIDEEKELRLTVKNIPFIQALSDCDVAIAPTEWQKKRFPAWAQEKIQVIHDGLNLAELSSVKPKGLGIPSQGLRLKKGMPIVTFSARNLEPVRGFHYFMKAVPEILNGNPDAHIIIMGQDAGINNIGYGAQNPDNKSWRQTMKEELGDSVDWKRIHFLGLVDRKIYLAMLKLSAAHVYLTTPFILSWSFLEAAALGLPIIASDTEPVREFSDLKNVELVDFKDTHELAQKVLYRLAHPVDYADANIEVLKQLDISHTLPTIKNILLEDSIAYDRGEPLEDLIIIEEEDF